MIKEAIENFMDGKSLTRHEAYEVMDEILTGKVTEAQISAFLVALQLKGSNSLVLCRLIEKKLHHYQLTIPMR